MRFLAALLLSLYATFAHADIWADYYAALDRFNAMLTEKAKNSAMPDIHDKDVAAVISVLTDSKQFLMPPAEPFDDISELTGFCDNVGLIVKRYVFSGVKIGPVADESEADWTRRVLKQSNENFIKYQDMLALLEPFHIQCLSGAVPIVSKAMKSLKPEEITAVRLQGIQQSRDGIAALFSSMLQQMDTPGVREATQTALAKAMATTAPTYASILKPNVRLQISERVKTLQKVLGAPLFANLDTIAKTMANTNCEGLCKY